MRGKIKAATAFGTLRAGRKRTREEAYRYGTFFVAKTGHPYKIPATRHITAQEAQAKAKYLEKLNPGKRVVVRKLN